MKLPLAKIAEQVNVGRDPRERASDPRSDAFATVLGETEIQELPDDPDEMEQALKDMAGPGAVIRVNGFRGGKLPPKNQIQQIRFHRNMFAADMHEPGFVSIDIITKPGFDSWRGATNMGFRDSVLSARNAFAPVKPDERNERAGFSLSGPLSKQKTSLALSVDGLDAFDSTTINAALPAGRFADAIRRPNQALNVSARVEQALGKSQVLRAEIQRNHTFNDNLGVGDFDLAERAYSQTQNETVARLSASGSIRKSLFNEFRFQWRSRTSTIDPASTAPAVLVLNAFDEGGAQISGQTGAKEFELADNLDIAAGRNAIRAGLLLEGGRYRTDQLRNAGGTFTFASLADYAALRPTTFTRNTGDPLVEVGHVQSGVYAQDDFRARKDLTISFGARQEIQTARRRPARRAARRRRVGAVPERQDDGARGRRHLLRLVRRAELRAGGAARRHATRRSRRSSTRAIPIRRRADARSRCRRAACRSRRTSISRRCARRSPASNSSCRATCG